MMRALRVIQAFGTVLIVGAVIVMIFAHARPNIGGLAIPAVIAIAAGIVVGIILRFSVPLNARLRAMHALSPRLARRFLPRDKGPSE